MTDKSTQWQAWMWLLAFAMVSGGFIYYEISSNFEKNKAFEAKSALMEKERIAAEKLADERKAAYDAARKKRAAEATTDDLKFSLITNDCRTAIHSKLEAVTHVFADRDTAELALFLAGFKEYPDERNLRRLKAGAKSVEYVVAVYPPEFSSFVAVWSCQVDPDGLGSSNATMERRVDMQ